MKSPTNRHTGHTQFRALCRICLLMAVLMPVLTSSQRREPRLDEMYSLYIIVDAEASGYDDDEFEQIDYEEFLSTIHRARIAYIAFEPAWQVNLFDDDGIRYSVYVSKSCRFLRIDSNYFKLSKRAAKRLNRLLTSLG